MISSMSNGGLPSGRSTPAVCAFAGGASSKACATAHGRPLARQGTAMPDSTARLRHDADIGLGRLPALRVLLLGVLVRHRAGDDHVLAVLPVHRRRHLVLG